MPKLYEYFGIVILFYSSEHQPIHVHGKFQGRESKAEIILYEGKIQEIRIVNVPQKRPLEGNKLADFKKFVEVYADKIVENWIDYFVYNKSIKPKIITRRIK